MTKYLKAQFCQRHADPLDPRSYGPKSYTYIDNHGVVVGDLIVVRGRQHTEVLRVSETDVELAPELEGVTIKSTLGKVII